MSAKTECPACEAYTSSVLTAFSKGYPCPHCGLPAEAAEAVQAARKRGASEELIKRVTAAETRAAKAEKEAGQLRVRLDDLKALISRELDEVPEW